MMWGYGNQADAGIFAFVTWLVVLIDLILLGIFLWKKITK